MKVAILTTSYPSFAHDPSGHFVRADARKRAHAGDDVTVIAPRVSCHEKDPASDDDVRVVRIECGDAFGWPGVVARVADDPRRAIGLAKWMIGATRAVNAARDVDRIVAHWAVPNAWPIALRAKTRASLEVISHGGDVRALTAIPRALTSRIVLKIAARATSWQFVSRELHAALDDAIDPRARAMLARIARVEACAIEIPSAREEADAKRRALHGRRIFVAVGRLVASKRVDRAIDYVANAHSDRLQNTRDRPLLVVVGDGPERSRLEARARSRDVDARFVGRVDRIEALAWIAAADALLFASDAEGLSTVVREAEAMGTPVTKIN